MGLSQIFTNLSPDLFYLLFSQRFTLKQTNKQAPWSVQVWVLGKASTGWGWATSACPQSLPFLLGLSPTRNECLGATCSEASPLCPAGSLSSSSGCVLQPGLHSRRSQTGRTAGLTWSPSSGISPPGKSLCRPLWGRVHVSSSCSTTWRSSHSLVRGQDMVLPFLRCETSMTVKVTTIEWEFSTHSFPVCLLHSFGWAGGRSNCGTSKLIWLFLWGEF